MVWECGLALRLTFRQRFIKFCFFRDDVIKRKRQEMIEKKAPATNAASTPNLNGLDPSTITIQAALEFQQQHKLDIETFTSNIANKMKFQLKDFNILCQLIYFEDQTTKLMGLIGMRKLLSIENTPPI